MHSSYLDLSSVVLLPEYSRHIQKQYQTQSLHLCSYSLPSQKSYAMLGMQRLQPEQHCLLTFHSNLQGQSRHNLESYSIVMVYLRVWCMDDMILEWLSVMMGDLDRWRWLVDNYGGWFSWWMCLVAGIDRWHGTIAWLWIHYHKRFPSAVRPSSDHNYYALYCCSSWE